MFQRLIDYLQMNLQTIFFLLSFKLFDISLLNVKFSGFFLLWQQTEDLWVVIDFSSLLRDQTTDRFIEQIINNENNCLMSVLSPKIFSLLSPKKETKKCINQW